LISAIIPARNEEVLIARAVESVAAQAEISEVIVVDDDSTDATPRILAELAARIPKMRVVRVAKLPPGWMGKNYAASVGAAEARGDWLVFADADTYHYPGAAQRALADAVKHNAALVSYSPEQELGSFWERALVPMVYCRLAAKFSYARVNNPRSPDAAANGQYILILRDVYEKLGGHAAIAGELLEDVALARRVKQAGYRIYFMAVRGVVRTRMYRTFRDMWEGWTKNLYVLLGGKTSKVFGEFLIFAPWVEVCLFIEAIVLNVIAIRLSNAPIRTMAHILFLCAIVPLAAQHIRYGVSLHRNLYPVRYIKYYVPGVVVYTAAVLNSWWKNKHGSVVWKGREYPSRTP